MRNLQIAAGVALALAGVSAEAAFPTTAQCGAPNNTLYIAGSSAAQNAFSNALSTDLFGGQLETFSASNGNFKVYCGFAAAGNTAGITANNVVAIHYRGEGGSVVGALPVVSGKAIKFIDLTQAGLPAGGVASVAITTTGTSAAQGTSDGWGGPLTAHTVEVGITDVEPARFTGLNYPSAYAVGVFGSATQTQLSNLPKKALFQQVFGLFANTTGISTPGCTVGSAAGDCGQPGQAISIGSDAAANILNGNYTDWSNVPSYPTGAPVSSVAQAITLINREAGSGSRTGTSIYFGLNSDCNPKATGIISDPVPANDGYATGDVLTTANATNGGITYASIDNNGSKANLTMVSLNGVAPNNQTAAAGGYSWWYEATIIQGTITSPGGAGIYAWLSGGELSSVATGPHLADNNAIANAVVANTATVPLTSNTLGGKTIYVSDYSRGGNSCNGAIEQN
jgi:hypothetical protein